jgi:hypothetical protein
MSSVSIRPSLGEKKPLERQDEVEQEEESKKRLTGIVRHRGGQSNPLFPSLEEKTGKIEKKLSRKP